MAEQSSDPTQNVLAQSVTLAHPHLELQLVLDGQREYRFPFLSEEISFAQEAAAAFPAGSTWSARLKGDSVLLCNSDNGESRPLHVGESAVLDGANIWLLDVRQPPVGTLEGVDAPFTGRVWHLKGQQTLLGRRGKRLNHIELEHPTVSRAHATFLPDRHGQVSLMSESAGSATTVNGEALAPGATKRLRHGDLIGIGQLFFRFSVPAEASSTESLISIRTLGTFLVSLGGDANLGQDVRNEKSRWLLARLALQWGEPLAVESLLEEFWPGVAATRGRKNLSYTLLQLRDSLALDDAAFESLVLRTPSTLQLNPERLGQHDYTEVMKMTESRKPLTSAVALRRLLDLYRGPFLRTCYEDWADVARSKLEICFTETVLASGRAMLDHNEFEAVESSGRKLLEWDPTNEDAAGLLMEAYLKMAKPERAVEVYEATVKALKSEDLEPDPELMKLYYRASMGL